ncbi:MAG: hypothetical protein ACRDUB_09970 [Mycobacterium sp.]
MKVPSFSRALALAAVTTFALGTSACGSSEGSAGRDGALSVGVFLPGSVNDTGFMQSGYQGFQRVQSLHRVAYPGAQ